jgi:hypothetical protein
MRSRSVAALVLLVLLPTFAVAQRGGRGGGGGGRTSSDLSKPPAVRYPTVRDIDDHNPAFLLVDKRKKLSLSDSTVAQLKALEKVFKQRDSQTVAMYDSVRRRINSSIAQDVSEATPGLQMEDAQNKLGLRNLWADLRERRSKYAQEALALVPEDKRKAAADFLTEQEDDFLRSMPGGRGRSGAPPGDR